MDLATRKTPPRKQPGQGVGPRVINGLALDVRTAAVFVGITEKSLRGMISRRLVPFKKLNGRIVLMRAELSAWLQGLDGCSLDEARANQEARHD